MGKQTFNRIKKTLAILLVVLFVVSVTSGAVSAGKTHKIAIKSGNLVGHPTSGPVPLTVDFEGKGESTTSPITSYTWDFGDGSPSSTDQNPTHTYNTAGVYDVSLTVANQDGGSLTYTQKGYITVTGAASADTGMTVDFKTKPIYGTNGHAPLTVNFVDTSSNAVGWFWNFGDGSPSSTDQNPKHTYNTAGVYTVSLKAVDSNSNTGTEVKKNYIFVF